MTCPNEESVRHTRKRSRSSLRLCAIALCAWGPLYGASAYLQQQHPPAFRRIRQPQSLPEERSIRTISNHLLPEPHRLRATVIEEESDLKTEIEYAAHGESDKLELGSDMITGSINISSLELTARVEPPPRNETTESWRNMWRRRHARSAEEGIRREKTSQLSTLLAKVNDHVDVAASNSRRYAARTISGLINALAEEVDDLDVEVDARRDTPLSGKHVDAIRIKFSRLGFKPLRMGGLREAVETFQNKTVSTSTATDGEPLAKNPAMELTDLSCPDEAFDRIDVDQSGSLDPDEIAKALNLAAGGPDAIDAAENERLFSVIKDLASDLVQLYDFNGDGVVDRNEYQSMVEDMAALRRAQEEQEEEKPEEKEDEGWFGAVKNWVSGFFGGDSEDKEAAVTEVNSGLRVNGDSTDEKVNGALNVTDSEVNGARNETVMQVNGDRNATVMQVNGDRTATIAEPSTSPASGETFLDGATKLVANATRSIVDVTGSSEVLDSMAKTLGSITLSDLKIDIRRLIFGAIPILKHITPGGPLILEPFTTTVTGSFSADDIMNSFLLDAALRRLVARALRRRVRSIRDLMDGAVFYGRTWNMASPTAPVVEVLELSKVEFDPANRMIITGRARVRTAPDAPMIENSFKVRTKIGTRKGGRVVRLVEPELAFVLECPKSWEDNLTRLYKGIGWNAPVRPDPLYSFFPIYSPFALKENDGYYMGEDNTIKDIYIKDNALRFELSAVLRPGRFLGNHYLAFTVPQRTFIITLDRVREGIKAARKAKQAARALLKQSSDKEKARKEKGESTQQSLPASPVATAPPSPSPKRQPSTNQPKSFFSRFVDGYLSMDDEPGQEGDKNKAKTNDRLATTIRDFFGRQGAVTDEDE